MTTVDDTTDAPDAGSDATGTDEGAPESHDAHEAPDTPAGDDHEVEHAHDEEHPSDNKYITIALILAVITAAEVAASYVDLGPVFIPLLLFLMAIKFWTVVSYFMHLKFDNRIFRWAFYSGLGFALVVYIVMLLTFAFFT